MSLTKKREKILYEIVDLYKMYVPDLYADFDCSDEELLPVAESTIMHMRDSEDVNTLNMILTSVFETFDYETEESHQYEMRQLARVLFKRKDEFLSRLDNLYPHWSKNFKTVIMSITKVLGNQSSLPGAISILIFMASMMIPFMIIASTFDFDDPNTPQKIVFGYFPFYFVFTFFAARLMTILGRQWTQEEYDDMHINTTPIPYFLGVFFHGLFHYGLIHLAIFLFK